MRAIGVGQLSSALRMSVVESLSRQLQDPSYPCLGARSALRQGGLATRLYEAMGDETSTAALARDLAEFAHFANTARETSRFVAFAALFVQPAPFSEQEFETQLWQQLSALAAMDARPWATNASADVAEADFAFSFNSTPYFVIGMHPESSRLARRAGWPALVFNPHDQFRRLRADGQFEGIRSAIRERDRALQGDINPNLADAGEVSEARQYSGRTTESEWQCPFHRDRK